MNVKHKERGSDAIKNIESTIRVVHLTDQTDVSAELFMSYKSRNDIIERH